jgi:TetR/AcrR family transcriptional repressor of nem operon
MTEMNDRLLDAAEAAVRLRGYHAVSFRELADELGIKSASVHYYYRQKEDLGLALVARYQAHFFKRLDERAVGLFRFEQALAAFIAVYREALVGSDRICLCGMLGAESSGLPPPLAAAVAEFFEANIDWLDKRMPEIWPSATRRGLADSIVASLQGAMMLTASLKDHARFDTIAEELQARFGTL